MKPRLKILLLTATLLATEIFCRASAQPSLSPPVPLSNNLVRAQINLSNCTNIMLRYTLQTSTDLVNWTDLQTFFAVSSNLPFSVWTTNQLGFYRIVTSPIYQYAIVAKSNITFLGIGGVVDSFDPSSPAYSTGGQYDVSKRKAGAIVATDSSVSNAVRLGFSTVYGSVMTGPGTSQTNAIIGASGVVGDIPWNSDSNNYGYIEPGHWSGGFNVDIPDVPAPAASASLPVNAPVFTNGAYTSGYTNGVYYLTGGSYLCTSDPNKQLNINGPVILWVTTSYSPNITFSSNNPNASLALYVGATAGSAVALSLGRNGNLNYPGYARNFRIYGLPSLTTVGIRGNVTVLATIYAPEAVVTAGVGGAGTQDACGAIIANSVDFSGRWGFHYDESLATNGPTF